MTEIEFPAVTICSQGLNMENVARAVERDFYHWHKKTQVMESKIYLEFTSVLVTGK